MGALQVYMYLCPHSDPVTQHVHRVRDTIKVRLTYLSIYLCTSIYIHLSFGRWIMGTTAEHPASRAGFADGKELACFG